TIVFSAVPASSSLTLSGTIGGSAIRQQGPGSLTTTYSGSVTATWDQAGGTISFSGLGTSLTAANSGTWQPAAGGGSGSAPANYGAEVTVMVFITARAAVRSLVASISTGSALTVTGSGPTYSFPSTQLLTITNGFADYNAGLFGSGRESLAGQSANNT